MEVTNKDVCEFLEKNLNSNCCQGQSLEHWYKWLVERKRQHEHLSALTKRAPEDLITYRELPWQLKHEQQLLAESHYYNRADKHRGHPNFWITTKEAQQATNNIKKYVLCENYPGTLDFSRYTSSTINFGYFGVPKRLYQETGLNGKNIELFRLNKWKSHPVVKRDKHVAKKELLEMEPFRPDIDKLFVTGKGYLQEEEPPERVNPIIKITKPDKDDNQFWYWKNDIDSNSITPPILLIGKTVVTEGVNKTRYEWKFTFCNDNRRTNINRIGIANKGSTVVHYKWRKLARHNTSSHTPPVRVTKANGKPMFSFDHTEGLILPGKEISPIFVFRSFDEGYFKEVWQFLTTPSVTRAPLFFIFYGISDRNIENKTRLNIDNYFKKCIKIAKTVIARSENMKINVNLSSEKEKFLLANPGLCYRQDLVKRLKKMFFELTGRSWNYSLTDLRDVIINKMEGNEQTTKLHEFNRIYQILNCCVSKVDLLSRKYELVYDLLCEFVTEVDETLKHMKRIHNIHRVPNIKIIVKSVDSIEFKRKNVDLKERKNIYKEAEISEEEGEEVVKLERNMSNVEYKRKQFLKLMFDSFLKRKERDAEKEKVRPNIKHTNKMLLKLIFNAFIKMNESEGGEVKKGTDDLKIRKEKFLEEGEIVWVHDEELLKRRNILFDAFLKMKDGEKLGKEEEGREISGVGEAEMEILKKGVMPNVQDMRKLLLKQLFSAFIKMKGRQRQEREKHESGGENEEDEAEEEGEMEEVDEEMEVEESEQKVEHLDQVVIKRTTSVDQTEQEDLESQVMVEKSMNDIYLTISDSRLNNFIRKNRDNILAIRFGKHVTDKTERAKMKWFHKEAVQQVLILLSATLDHITTALAAT